MVADAGVATPRSSAAVAKAKTAAFESQRAGMATVLVFLAAGAMVLWGVREDGTVRGRPGRL